MLKTNWYSFIFDKKEFWLLRVLAFLRILSFYVKTILTDQSLFDSIMEYKIKHKILILEQHDYIKSRWRPTNSWLEKQKNINVEKKPIFIAGYCFFKNLVYSKV